MFAKAMFNLGIVKSKKGNTCSWTLKVKLMFLKVKSEINVPESNV